MRVVVFTHPSFISSTSMPLFAEGIIAGLRNKGHDVTRLTARPLVYRIPCPRRFKRWLGYIDQFLLFPVVAWFQTRKLPDDTLFVFADQALGPWMPPFVARPHVVHCHDFLALRSALGEFSQNPTGVTGRLYQHWIRRGFRRAKNFICVSENTRTDLLRFLEDGKDDANSRRAHVVYNGLNYSFCPMEKMLASRRLAEAGVRAKEGGYVLHVGGNQWYKNRAGVVRIYSAYAAAAAEPRPLLMIGAAPDAALAAAIAEVPEAGRVELLIRPHVEVLHAAYSLAGAMLFPSFAEGFGWPIIEAMACGCPVLTTDQSPMSEVGGGAAIYIPAPSSCSVSDWARQCASILEHVLALDPAERSGLRQAGIKRASEFGADSTMLRYTEIYEHVAQARTS